MNHEFGVTIATSINTDEIGSAHAHRYRCVLDLRHDTDGGAFPICETTLRRLRYFHVNYEQMPTSMSQASVREENELYRVICEQRGHVLLLTNEPQSTTQFCMSLDIPIGTRDLYVVGDEPRQMPPRANTGSVIHGQFDRIAS